MRSAITRLVGEAICAGAMLAAPMAFAQPAAAGNSGKPMHIVVGLTPAGAPGILARLIGDRITAAWGQPVLVDNRPGAGGNAGADFVAKAPTDGLTIYVGTVGTHAINGALYARMPMTWSRTSHPWRCPRRPRTCWSSTTTCRRRRSRSSSPWASAKA